MDDNKFQRYLRFFIIAAFFASWTGLVAFFSFLVLKIVKF